jgi:3-dehydroquinate synthase
MEVSVTDARRLLHVALAERSYPIHIGPGLLNDAGALLAPFTRGRAVIITNATVAAHHLAALRASLDAAGVPTDVILIPDGEAHKNFATLADVLTRLIELKAERGTLLIALGGGVVGDLAGFAASVYQRGMPYAQIPTTLLAQVDSSVGGKTAINHALAKNMIGAFWQPVCVLIDTTTLQTLPDREYRSGLAEVIKYGAIRDLGFFEWLEANADALLAREHSALAHAIETSCRIKAEIVAADERESGERALLNFGHTFGHAIEAGTGYGAWLHGEAVGVGMVLASRLSAQVRGVEPVDAQRLSALLAHVGLPGHAPRISFARWMELMGRDKKVERNEVRFVLLHSLGSAYAGANVPEQMLRTLLA